MDKKNINNNLDNIKNQLEVLKQRLTNMDMILNIQEEILDLINENTKSLFKDLFAPESKYSHESVDTIMKSVFSKGKIPKILFK